MLQIKIRIERNSKVKDLLQIKIKRLSPKKRAEEKLNGIYCHNEISRIRKLNMINIEKKKPRKTYG